MSKSQSKKMKLLVASLAVGSLYFMPMNAPTADAGAAQGEAAIVMGDNNNITSNAHTSPVINNASNSIVISALGNAQDNGKATTIENTNETIAMGNGVQVVVSDINKNKWNYQANTAIGTHAKILDSGLSVALGGETLIQNSTFAIAQGYGASIDNSNNSVALGATASVKDSQNGIAIGVGSKVNNAQSGIAIGASSKVSGWGSTAIGLGSNSTQNSVALGAYANASTNGSVAIGSGAKAGDGPRNWATAIGYGAKAEYGNSVAIGANSKTDEANTVSVGSKDNKRKVVNVADAEFKDGSSEAVTAGQLYAAGIVPGTAVNTVKNGTIAIGDGSQANSFGATALGYKSKADGSASTAIGWSSSASTDGTAIGYAASSARHSMAIGSHSKAGAEYSTAVGYGTNVTAPNAVGLGKSASVSGENSVALGADTKVWNKNSVVIGYQSSTYEDNTVSVGNNKLQRKVVNVADGKIANGSHDAVTGGQLYTTNQKLDALDLYAVKWDEGTTNQIKGVVFNGHGSVTVNNATIKGGFGAALTDPNNRESAQFVVNGATGAVQADGGVLTKGDVVADDVDADGNVLNSYSLKDIGVDLQAYKDAGIVPGKITANPGDTAKNSISIGAKSEVHGNSSIAIGGIATGSNQVAIGQSTVTKGNHATAVGNNSHANSESATALGYNTWANAENSVALGSGSVASEANTVSVGSKGSERKIVNVKAGEKDTDAVNVAQLKATNANVTANADDIKKVVAITGVDPLTGKNEGKTLTAAVNTNTADIKTNADNIKALNGNVKNAVKYDSDDHNTITFDGEDGTALKNVSSIEAKDVETENISADTATIGGVKFQAGQVYAANDYSSAWMDGSGFHSRQGDLYSDITPGKVAVGNGTNRVEIDGTSGTINGLSNKTFDVNAMKGSSNAATEAQVEQAYSQAVQDAGTAAGTVVKEAVGDQNYTKVEGTELKDGMNLTNAIGTVNNKVDAVDKKVGNLSDLHDGIEGDSIVDSINKVDTKIDNKINSVSGDINGVKDRVTAVEDKTTGITYDKNTQTTTIGGKAQFNEGGITMTGGGDVATENGSKLSTLGKTSDLDGELTKSDKYTSNQTVVGAVNAEADIRRNEVARIDSNVSALSGRVDSLESRMGDVEERIDKVGAMSAAIANLRTMGFDPEAPTEIAVGVGQYKSETGLALGVFHYPNQDFMLSASVSTSGDEVMGGIGATWKIGRKTAAERARISEEKAAEKA